MLKSRRSIVMTVLLAPVVVVVLVVFVSILGLILSPQPPGAHFNDGIRMQAYTFHSSDVVHCEWDGCGSCPMMQEFRFEVVEVTKDNGKTVVVVRLLKPQFVELRLQNLEEIHLPNPCSGKDEVVGIVEKITPAVSFSPWQLPYGISKYVNIPGFYSRSSVVIRFGKSWITKIYGPHEPKRD